LVSASMHSSGFGNCPLGGTSSADALMLLMCPIHCAMIACIALGWLTAEEASTGSASPSALGGPLGVEASEAAEHSEAAAGAGGVPRPLPRLAEVAAVEGVDRPLAAVRRRAVSRRRAAEELTSATLPRGSCMPTKVPKYGTSRTRSSCAPCAKPHWSLGSLQRLSK